MELIDSLPYEWHSLAKPSTLVSQTESILEAPKIKMGNGDSISFFFQVL